MPGLTETSTVLSVLPHYRNEQWLGEAIRSIRDQTRRPEAIVVVDDASSEPPVEIVERFPDVTLLHADRNVGPHAMLQAVFERAEFDAFMLQDSDDWSSSDRLSTLLKAAQGWGADMVGCQMSCVYEGIDPEVPFVVPEDARAAVLANPTVHPVIMPSSVIAKALIERVGGLSTGLRFGADSEFIRRAIFVGRVFNVPECCYFRRVHPHSLTRAETTGYASPERRRLQSVLQERSRQNVERVLTGEPPDLTPLVVGEPVKLWHLAGPRLAAFADETQ
jgi:glycosyltransferase involved in cell wall biosynthesis